MGSPLVTYDFSCDSSGNPEVYTKSVVGDLFGLNVSMARCDFGNNGITSTEMIASRWSISRLREAFMETNATGFSIELWITPIVNHDFAVSQPIFTISGDNFDDDDGYNVCRNTEISIGVRGNHFEIKYVDNDEWQSCRTLFVRQEELKDNELVQVILSLNHGETSVYIDGEPVIQGAPNKFVTNLTLWNPESKVQLFSNAFLSNIYNGTLHRVSIHDQAMHVNDTGLLYEIGLQDIQRNHKPLHLVASKDPVFATQGNSSLITVGSFNRSTDDYTVQVEIISLPQFGNFLTPNGTITSSGQRFELDLNSTLSSILYRPWSKDVFTSPRFSYSGQDLQLPIESFEYRLVAVSNNGLLLGWSEIVEQEVIILHVNQRPTLILPKIATPLPEQDPAFGARPVAALANVVLHDPDRNIDRVRVDVWAMNGTLEIHNNVELADFESCAERYDTDWWCHGSGGGLRNMTFVAEPDDVSTILSNVKYTGFYWDQEDSIVIRIFDGSGGGCLKEEEHKYHSIHLGCYKADATISVPAISKPPDRFDFRNISFAQVLFYIVLATVLLACSRVCLCIRGLYNRIRGATIESVENEDEVV